ncbi:MAG: Putative threonine efflux protein [uncultured Truepera sp.]|uniref:Threonine efflux protein n=1 Tax=uncultured Truepera sp. TaxID=543023 RepID=A0A6J4VUX7_9DEIN|nr:MAG: Putative threonine efflux protein [uncultured Truepera sp.]
MSDLATFSVFFASALTLAVIPGPGMLYVLARTVRGGRREGVLSTLGTGVAGMLHTLAAALGVSAVLATSALAFSVIKWLGVAYLIYLGVKTLLEKDTLEVNANLVSSLKDAFAQGVTTKVLNPKTALFFLAFIPQFVNPDGQVFLQFVTLGLITTLLTSGVDFIVALAAGPLSGVLKNRRGRRVQRALSGGALIGLGVYVAVDR